MNASYATLGASQGEAAEEYQRKLLGKQVERLRTMKYRLRHIAQLPPDGTLELELGRVEKSILSGTLGTLTPDEGAARRLQATARGHLSRRQLSRRQQGEEEHGSGGGTGRPKRPVEVEAETGVEEAAAQYREGYRAAEEYPGSRGESSRTGLRALVRDFSLTRSLTRESRCSGAQAPAAVHTCSSPRCGL